MRKRTNDYPHYREFIKENAETLKGCNREEKHEKWLYTLREEYGFTWDEFGHMYI